MTRVGIDIGGTFTDLVVVDEEEIRTEKAPSTPDDPSQGALDVLEKADISLEDIETFDHGTTIATNVAIERNPGAEIVFLTNDGFRDIPEIMRTERENQYDRQWVKPDPLVPRTHRYGIRGRIGVDGAEVEPFDEAQARDIVRKHAASPERTSYAISMLFSFRNPAHEQALVEIIREEHPDAYVSASHDIFPQSKEYERASTVIANAYVKPKMEHYVGNLDTTFRREGGRVPINIMQSNGGLLPTEEVVDVPAKTLFSGLAAGVAGGAHFGLSVAENLITMDMGGTSCDVGIISDGDPEFTTEGEIQWGMPVQFPQVDIETIGAGGGSIAWVDEGGHLKVGPQSAGADPGPVCYGRGGEQPTVTDANLVLGRLNPDNFLGGDMALDVDAARRSLNTLADQLEMSVEETALGIIKISTNKLTQAMRTMTVERGYDPRKFGLVACGGAGPMHALQVAKIADIPRAIIPPNPGVLSASGLLTTDFRYDQLHSFIHPLDELETAHVDELNEIVEKMVAEGDALLEDQADAVEAIRFLVTADLRYYEQAYEVNVPLTDGTTVSAADLEAAAARFHEEHERLFGHSNESDRVELVNVRVTTVGERPLPPAFEGGSTAPEGNESVEAARKETREVIYAQGTFDTPVYDRANLPVEERLDGPCVVEEQQSTTVVFPGQVVTADAAGNLIVEVSDE